MSESSWSLAHFLAQTDTVCLGVLTILTVMSLLSWYLIVYKIGLYVMIRKRSREFITNFRQARQSIDAEHLQAASNEKNPFARLLGEGLQACLFLREVEKNHAGKTNNIGFGMASPDDYVSAALAHGIAGEMRRLEHGMTALASIASTAPFVGLFGTVWGIFHALQNIALTAQASLDKVAGPVGEALIMTAYGLFASIPALLAYNAFTRQNRHLIGDLERFAHTVFGLLGSGLTSSESPSAELSVVTARANTAKAERAG